MTRSKCKNQMTVLQRARKKRRKTVGKHPRAERLQGWLQSPGWWQFLFIPLQSRLPLFKISTVYLFFFYCRPRFLQLQQTYRIASGFIYRYTLLCTKMYLYTCTYILWYYLILILIVSRSWLFFKLFINIHT